MGASRAGDGVDRVRGDGRGLPGHGVATAPLRHMLAFPQFKTYVFEDIADTNAPALGLYEKLGFREFKREKVRHTKRTGTNAYVSMRLTQA
ncbi:hypothetical protein [Saccharopolyspora shandongensis]|uniref:hypothetical protein n=1 Tax=Saccharopolyspora shandongensis TaxID=418495 RepID=UPI0033E9E91C